MDNREQERKEGKEKGFFMWRMCFLMADSDTGVYVER